MHFVLAQLKDHKHKLLYCELEQELTSHWLGAQGRYGYLRAYLRDLLLIYLFSDKRRGRHCSLSRSFEKPYWIDSNQVQQFWVHYMQLQF